MKKIGLILTVCMLSMMLWACAGEEKTTENTVTEQDSEVAGEAQTGDKQTIEENEQEEIIPEEEATSQVQTIRTVNIYYSNEMADGLEKDFFTTEEITPELLLSRLSEHNIVTEDTKALSCEVLEEDGKVILSLDMSVEFKDYICSMGTAGEYVILGALTNTFLDAYEAEGLRLTVEGEYLETGHAIYEGDLNRFSMTSGEE